MNRLLTDIRACRECVLHLPHGPRPVIQAHPLARLLIIGQAPGAKVHESGVPWMDASGRQLREWLGIDDATFYDAKQVALMPMGFCYPGKGKSGDLPPRPECAPLWHERVRKQLKNVKLTLLIGQYSQQHYLGDEAGENLTETVRAFEKFLPNFLPLPHPSPRNRFWLTKNKWFVTDLLPVLQATVVTTLAKD